MTDYNRYACLLSVSLLLMICLCPVLLIMPVSAADAEIDAYLGDTVTISGVSYTSDRIYLFFTGPGLPANGVTLTDTSQQADQGRFTIVDVGSDQSWSMRWDTSRISSSIDPGTYTVYATTEPVDKANLGGTSTYKTLEVWLKDPHTSKVSISAGASYTLNPEKHSSSSNEVPTLIFPSATPTPSPLPTTAMTMVTTAVATAPPAPPQATKAAPDGSVTIFAAGISSAVFLFLNRRK